MQFIYVLSTSLSHWQNLGGQFRNRHLTHFWSVQTMILWTLACAGALAIAVWAHRRVQRYRATSPWGLFGELASAHHLSRQDVRRLKRLYQVSGLGHPAHLFVEPSMFETARLRRWFPDDWTDFVPLNKKLFGRE